MRRIYLLLFPPPHSRAMYLQHPFLCLRKKTTRKYLGVFISSLFKQWQGSQKHRINAEFSQQHTSVSKEIKLLNVFLPQASSICQSHTSCDNQHQQFKPFLTVLPIQKQGRIKKILLHIWFLSEAVSSQCTGYNLTSKLHTRTNTLPKKNFLSFFHLPVAVNCLRPGPPMRCKQGNISQCLSCRLFCSNNTAAKNSLSSSLEQPLIALTYARHPLSIQEL